MCEGTTCTHEVSFLPKTNQTKIKSNNNDFKKCIECEQVKPLSDFWKSSATTYKRKCKTCARCPHNKRKDKCNECGKSSFCEHGRQRFQCKDCGGSSYCSHGVRKAICQLCGGNSLCEHGKQKYQCKDCQGSSYCPHNVLKQFCNTCGGKALCEVSECETKKNPKYRGYCFRHFCDLFPDEAIVRNCLIKERAVREFLDESLPELEWVHNKRLPNNITGLKPDHRASNLKNHLFIVETDEDKHCRINHNNEMHRLQRLSDDVKNIPLICIRFNPDSYKEGGKTIKSCFKVNRETRVLEISRKRDWQKRLERLKQEIQTVVEKQDEIVEPFTVIYLFYGDDDASSS